MAASIPRATDMTGQEEKRQQGCTRLEPTGPGEGRPMVFRVGNTTRTYLIITSTTGHLGSRTTCREQITSFIYKTSLLGPTLARWRHGRSGLRTIPAQVTICFQWRRWMPLWRELTCRP